VLLAGEIELGRGTQTMPAERTEVGVPISTPAPAKDVTRVHVELAGGEVPVPTQCESMTFDRVIFGTLGDDTIAGTAQRDLIYGLSGNDTIDGGPQADCIVGGAGNNVLRGGAGDDVIIGGPGDDTIYSGPGRNVVDAGGGTNTCTVSPQTNHTGCTSVTVRQGNQW
jgi:Ca2+-binding RTX toxin-like protein